MTVVVFFGCIRSSALELFEKIFGGTNLKIVKSSVFIFSKLFD